jgi:hypothetical protein
MAQGEGARTPRSLAREISIARDAMSVAAPASSGRQDA